MTKPRNIRTRVVSSDESDEDKEIKDNNVTSEPVLNTAELVSSIRDLQSLRKRPAGVSLECLTAGKPKPKVSSVSSKDPFKLKTGGLVTMQNVYKQKTEGTSQEEVELGLTQVFAAETNKRDEDAEMLKYIEEEMAKRKGLANDGEGNGNSEHKGADLLNNVPDHLKPVIGQQKEDMLSNQMLCGIPEVDLGVEAKMKNIEATEEAKQKLIKDRFDLRNKSRQDDFAPANISVNFVQHSRWNNQGDHHARAEQRKRNFHQTNAANVSNEAGGPNKFRRIRGRGGYSGVAPLDAERHRIQTEKATDTLVLQRFKNYMRDKRRR